jgi:phosphatidylserine/phosphatidylglycerophosphate/cardiolipin synthase-like enzyme
VAYKVGTTANGKPMATLGPRSYVHAKTWVFDDELAIIGSANCNRRGWESDSEVVAAVLDKPASLKAPSFAQALRTVLWARHLGIPEETARSSSAAFQFWPTQSVPRYGFLEWYDLAHDIQAAKPENPDQIDPGDTQLPACSSPTR